MCLGHDDTSAFLIRVLKNDLALSIHQLSEMKHRRYRHLLIMWPSHARSRPQIRITTSSLETGTNEINTLTTTSTMSYNISSSKRGKILKSPQKVFILRRSIILPVCQGWVVHIHRVTSPVCVCVCVWKRNRNRIFPSVDLKGRARPQNYNKTPIIQTHKQNNLLKLQSSQRLLLGRLLISPASR